MRRWGFAELDERRKKKGFGVENETLQIGMFGGLQVSCGSRTLAETHSHISKPLELLVLLVLNRNSQISNEQLIEALWEEGEVENPAAALKNAAYSLRKSLQALCPGVSFVVTRERQYCWNNQAPVELDVEHFGALHHEIGEEEDPGLRLEKCREALGIYNGDFLPSLADRHWVIPRASALRQQYLDITITAASLLLNCRTKATAEEALALCNRAVLVEPLDEELYLHLFAAMQQLGMKTAVLKYYPVVANIFFDELGEAMPASLRSVYQWASESSNPAADDILHIQKDLDEVTRDSRPIRGAYFCQYEVFKHMYHMVVRSTARTGGCVALFLLTLLPLHGQTVPKQEHVRVMLALKEQVQRVLRKGDVFSRYSRNQYVLMLSVRDMEDSRVVQERLREAYRRLNPPRTLRMDVTAARPESIV